MMSDLISQHSAVNKLHDHIKILFTFYSYIYRESCNLCSWKHFLPLKHSHR